MTSSITIRAERADDIPAIRMVNDVAFGRPNEARLMDDLRESDAYVSGLSLVAEADGGPVVGHVLLTYADLVGDDGAVRRRVLSLAPLAVFPDRQGRGIGSALAEAGIAAAEALGEPLIVVLGHARYYPRFGFEPASRHGIVSPLPVSDEVFMVRRLAAYDPELRGQIRYPSAFDSV